MGLCPSNPNPEGINRNQILEVKLDGLESRKYIAITDKNGKIAEIPLFFGDEKMSGTLEIKLQSQNEKTINHQGVKIDVVGRVECLSDPKQSFDFMSTGNVLEATGMITLEKSYKFAFNDVIKQYPHYSGTLFLIRYFLRAAIFLDRSTKVMKEVDFAVLPKVEPKNESENVNLEIGVPEALEVKFEYNKKNEDGKCSIVGQIEFVLMKALVRSVEVQIIKREIITNVTPEDQIIEKVIVKEGLPKKGEILPVNLSFGTADLAPEFSINGKFSVTYFVKLCLVELGDTKYNKLHKLTI